MRHPQHLFETLFFFKSAPTLCSPVKSRGTALTSADSEARPDKRSRQEKRLPLTVPPRKRRRRNRASVAATQILLRVLHRVGVTQGRHQNSRRLDGALASTWNRTHPKFPAMTEALKPARGVATQDREDLSLGRTPDRLQI